ncbi:MAG TPA: hypothetical protein DCZ94_13070 [Lentisphaeria bacterium]|nr:MAG: hypothetical protein A2X48_06200 [Lentisphaerae bacterium GWF2_49_21]HBC87880.1 hypothetical protein [Lentisphaeria bacterium]
MKKGKSPKTVQEKACAKPECTKAAPVCDKESNLKKLAKSGKVESFVKKNKGNWDHQSWLVFCSEISVGGYEPIDFDKVGLMLEEQKAKFLGQI